MGDMHSCNVQACRADGYRWPGLPSQMALCPPTHPPPSHPLIHAICDIAVAVKKVAQYPAVLASRNSYQTLAK